MSLKRFLFTVSILMVFTGYGQYDVEKVKKDTAKGQKNEKLVRSLKENTYVGSGLNLLLGNNFYVYASPQIGYEFIPKLSAGFLSLIQYQRSTNPFTLSTQTVRSLGAGIFLRYRPFNFLVLESSYNRYRIRASATGQIAPFEISAQSLMVGLGYTRSIGKKSYTNILISYDLIGDEFNPEPTLFSSATSAFALYFKFGVVVYPFNL